MLEPSRTLADEAYDRVEQMIVTLELAPGSTFTEAALAAQIGIGRTPLREALQRLAADRLVVALPRRGMMVTEINAGTYLALLETRRVLERLVVARAARRARPSQREALRGGATTLQQAARLGDLATFMALDRACDAVLEAAADNPFATRALTPLHAHCRRFWYRYRHEADLAESAALHAGILEAVADGNEAAAATAADALIDYLERFTRTSLGL